MGNYLKGTVLVLVAVLVLATFAPAQTSRGTVQGIVTDATGAVVPNAKVTLTQVETKVVRETVSNETGFYRFDAVNLGTYEIKITASGFATFVTHGVGVQANQTARIDAALQIGSTETTVNVEAGAAVIELQRDEQLRGRNIETRALTDLPVAGQNSLNLMTLIPGVVPTTLDGGGSLDSGIGSVNGSRPRANNFLIDGVENNDISVAGPAVTLTNNDAIQEVSVQTSNFSAEFGRSGGAVINQITKSGTNNLHGTAAWIYRSQKFNASNFDQRYSYFKGGKDDGEPLKPSFLEHTPAFTVGGPVYIPGVYNGKNKTFFFVGGQWDRYNSGATQRIVSIPTAAGKAVLQQLAATCPNAQMYLNSIGNLVASTPLDTISLAVPTDVYNLTSSNVCTSGTSNPNRQNMVLEYGTYTRAVPRLYYGNTIQTRVDHAVSLNHQLSFRFMSSPGSYKGVYALGLSPEFDAGYLSKSYTGAITHTWIVKSNLTNELRLNYHRTAVDWPLMAEAGSPGATFPTVAIRNLTTLGTSASYPQGRTFNNYQMQDTMTWVAGKHTIRFGFDINKQIARQSAPITKRGALTFSDSTVTLPSGSFFVSGFSNFLDDFSGDAGTNPVSRQFGTPVYHPTVFRQSYFIQDAWKLRPNLTLNLGLRYDYFGQPANGNFPYPAVSLDAANFPNKTKIPEDRNNFGPTVGFAYTPQFGFFEDGKTVIRGGFQIGYDGWYNNLLSNMAAGAPNNPTNIAHPATIVPATPRGVAGMYNVLFPALTPAAFNDPRVTTSSQFTQNIRNPYTMRSSLGVQRELMNKLVVDVSYVGSLGRKLFITRELNPRLPNASNVAGSRLRPELGSRTVRDSAANSNYNALQIDTRLKPVDTALGNITLSSNYTWSKNLDVVSETFATSGAQSAYASSQWMALTDLGVDYGLSDLHRSHRWVTTLMWDIRGPKQGILGQVLGGWSIGTNIPVMSGTPFTVSNGRDRDGDGGTTADRPDIGNPNAPITSRAIISTTAQACASGLWNPDAKACTTADQVRWVQSSARPGARTARRNNVTTGAFWSADLNLLKKFTIREGLKLEYRAEIFNVLNHQNFNYPATGLDGIGLRITQPAGRFMSYDESDYFTHPGNRTMLMGLKFIF